MPMAVKFSATFPLLATIPLNGGTVVEPTGNEPKIADGGLNATHALGAVEIAVFVKNASDSGGDDWQLLQTG